MTQHYHQALLILANHYRDALREIREQEVPFTRSWKLANDALQKAPIAYKEQQLDMFSKE